MGPSVGPALFCVLVRLFGLAVCGERGLRPSMHTHAGVSQVETLVSVIVLAVGLSGAATMLAGAVRSERMAAHQVRALRHASLHLERLESLECDSPDSVWVDSLAHGSLQQWSLTNRDSVWTIRGVIDLQVMGTHQRTPFEVQRRCAD